MTTSEWSWLISFALAPQSSSEWEGSEKSEMKINVSIGIRAHVRYSATGKSALQTARPHWLDIKRSIYSLTVS